jgi:hypothetical protein
MWSSELARHSEARAVQELLKPWAEQRVGLLRQAQCARHEREWRLQHGQLLFIERESVFYLEYATGACLHVRSRPADAVLRFVWGMSRGPACLCEVWFVWYMSRGPACLCEVSGCLVYSHGGLPACAKSGLFGIMSRGPACLCEVYESRPADAVLQVF